MNRPNIPPVVREVPQDTAFVASAANMYRTDLKYMGALEGQRDAEHTHQVARNIGHIATRRIVDSSFSAPYTVDEMDARNDTVYNAAVGAGRAVNPNDLLTPDDIRVAPTSRRERRMEHRMEKKLQKLSLQRVRHERSRAISAASQGAIDMKETKRLRKQRTKVIRQARRDGTISSRDAINAIGENSLYIARQDAISPEKRNNKRIRATRKAEAYAGKIEKRTSNSAVRARKKAVRWEAKAARRRTKFEARRTDRTARVAAR